MNSDKLTAPQVDQLVAKAVKERRLLLGMTLVDFAKELGVTYQQAGKYESAHNRMASSRLHRAAQVLFCNVADFYESTPPMAPVENGDADRYVRLPFQLARDFLSMTDRKRAALVKCTRAVSNAEPSEDAEESRQFAYSPERCPSNHWNGGDDICEDCGADLQAESPDA